MKNINLTNKKKYLILIMLLLGLSSCGVDKSSEIDDSSGIVNDNAVSSMEGKELKSKSYSTASEGSDSIAVGTR